MEALREALGEEAFSRAWAEHLAMAGEEAIALALNETARLAERAAEPIKASLIRTSSAQFAPDIPIEQGSDRYALIVDSDTCTLYELYAADWNDGDPVAGSGAIFGLGSNALRPNAWTSADAAGLQMHPGLVRDEEVEAGAITHAIRFTAECTRNRHIWPARHNTGVADRSCPPMGACFRLRTRFDITGFGPEAQVILTAMQRYGLILADNGSDWFFQGTMDERWTDDLLDRLKSVPASGFVAVDVSSCRVSADSDRSDCP